MNRLGIAIVSAIVWTVILIACIAGGAGIIWLLTSSTMLFKLMGSAATAAVVISIVCVAFMSDADVAKW